MKTLSRSISFSKLKPWTVITLVIITIVPAFALADVVRPVAQTAPMLGSGDVADDVCVWIHPADRSSSVILGCNKSEQRFGGVYAFGLDGSRWKDREKWRAGVNWFAGGQKINNVDICRGFRAGHEEWDIVAAANRSSRTLDLFRVRVDENGDFSRLEMAGCIPIGAGFAEGSDAPYGMALALLKDGRCMAFTSDKHGRVAQFEFSYNQHGSSTNRILARRIDDAGRLWQISGQRGEVEGIVVDAQRSVVYIASEKEGVFRYDLKNGLLDPKSKVVVDRVGSRLKADVEGLALYSLRDGTGYLIASSQGSSEFAVYQREFEGRAANLPVKNFTIGKSEKIDAVTETDGIEAVAVDFGGEFREGVFIAHDGEGESNYKLVPWSAIGVILRTE